MAEGGEGQADKLSGTVFGASQLLHGRVPPRARVPVRIYGSHVPCVRQDERRRVEARSRGEEILRADPLLQDPNNELLQRHLRDVRFEMKDYSMIS